MVDNYNCWEGVNYDDDDGAYEDEEDERIHQELQEKRCVEDV